MTEHSELDQFQLRRRSHDNLLTVGVVPRRHNLVTSHSSHKFIDYELVSLASGGISRLNAVGYISVFKRNFSSYASKNSKTNIRRLPICGFTVIRWWNPNDLYVILVAVSHRVVYCFALLVTRNSIMFSLLSNFWNASAIPLLELTSSS